MNVLRSQLLPNNKYKLGDVTLRSITKLLMILVLYRLARASACNQVNGSKTGLKSANVDVHQLKETWMMKTLIATGLSKTIESGTMILRKSLRKNNKSFILLR